MSHRMTVKIALIAGLAALAGCDSRDPYLRTDVWRPTGANAGNIATMVADPHDLISGHGAGVENANASALAVTHVWQDHPKPLLGASGGGTASGAGGGGQSGSGDSGGGAGAASGTPGS